MTEAAGLYVHLPFCARRCPYCTFAISTDAAMAPAYHRWLLAEADLASRDAGNAPFDTIYLGGGTPSRSATSLVAELLEHLRRRFRIAEDAEVTAEANPEDVSGGLLADWAAAGINRISLGVQSFDNRVLVASGRGHTGSEALRAVGKARTAGFRVSVDLIAGLPAATLKTFESDVSLLVRSGVGHASIYLLEVDTAHPIAADRILRPELYLSDDQQAEAYLAAGTRLAENGFEHYEVSSFARRGERARHNAKYWARTPTIGLGASAHEFWRGERRANTSSLPLYGAQIDAGRRSLAERSRIDEREAAREKILLGLRTADGVAAADLSTWFDRPGGAAARSEWDEIERSGLAVRGDGNVRMTERGFLLLNEVLCRIS